MESLGYQFDIFFKMAQQFQLHSKKNAVLLVRTDPSPHPFSRKVITALIFGQILSNRSATTMFSTHLDRKYTKYESDRELKYIFLYKNNFIRGRNRSKNKSKLKTIARLKSLKSNF